MHTIKPGEVEGALQPPSPELALSPEKSVQGSRVSEGGTYHRTFLLPTLESESSAK